jgi:hypothetical protein
MRNYDNNEINKNLQKENASSSDYSIEKTIAFVKYIKELDNMSVSSNYKLVPSR